MNSAGSLKGVANCTHYAILYDNTDISPEEIYQMTFFLTFNCYNSMKSIKIPTPLYNVKRRCLFVKNNDIGMLDEHKKTFNDTL